MPIYEFQCTDCGEKESKSLFRNNDERIEMKCEKCGCEDLQRVLNSTNFSVSGGGSGSGASGATASTHKCSGGSCTTYNIPGPSR